jgi:glycosyltransferase involved in cell wall biosynthesis
VTTIAPPERRLEPGPPTQLVVTGVRNPRSAGIARYAARLAQALTDHDVVYPLVDQACSPGPIHFHLGNSSRGFLRQARGLRAPFSVTVHDVVPRTAALLPVYRLLAYPQLAERAAAVIVHTRFAADMLVREAGRPRRLEVIALPAPQPRDRERSAARRALGWPEHELIAVVPGVIKTAKLPKEAVRATAGASPWRLALAGKLADRSAVREARACGTLILPDPNDRDYERAIVASDCVLCLRSGSVGETNAPLLDALGAGRAVLATATGSIPEAAGDAAHYCDGTERGIRAGLAGLADGDTRMALEAAAAKRAAGLTWEASAVLHAALFREVFVV